MEHLERELMAYYAKADKLADKFPIPEVYLGVSARGRIGKGLEITYQVGLYGRYGDKVEAASLEEAWVEAMRRAGWTATHEKRKLIGHTGEVVE